MRVRRWRLAARSAPTTKRAAATTAKAGRDKTRPYALHLLGPAAQRSAEGRGAADRAGDRVRSSPGPSPVGAYQISTSRSPTPRRRAPPGTPRKKKARGPRPRLERCGDGQERGDGARNPQTVAYIGDLNTGATELSLPILNQAGIVQLTPGSGYPGLTDKVTGVTVTPGEPTGTTRRAGRRCSACPERHHSGRRDSQLAEKVPHLSHRRRGVLRCTDPRPVDRLVAAIDRLRSSTARHRCPRPTAQRHEAVWHLRGRACGREGRQLFRAGRPCNTGGDRLHQRTPIAAATGAR